MTGRPVRESLSVYSEFALPNDANPLGTELGGRVMHLVHIGELIVLRASVNRVFRSSMEVGVWVEVENLASGQVRHTSSAYLTFVGLGKDGKRVTVIPVVPETDEEKRRYEEAAERRAQRLQMRARRGRRILLPPLRFILAFQISGVLARGNLVEGARRFASIRTWE